jgi:hypothetical protein
MLALVRSSGTPLYPPIAGNFTTSWQGLQVTGENLPSRLVDVLGASTLPWVFIGIVLAGIALIALRPTREWAKTPLLALAVAEATAITLIIATGFASDDLTRYAWPLLAGVLVASAALLAGQVSWPLRQRSDRAAVLVLVGVVLAIPIASPVGGELDNGATGISNVLKGDDDSLVTLDRFRYEYAVAQDSAPRGARIAVSVDNPVYFDYDRNDLVNLDLLGAVSPSPGLPLGGSTNATTDYLRKEGFQFVIATDPRISTCLYSEKGWRINQDRNKPEGSMSPYFLDWFNWQRRRARQAPRSSTRYASLTVFDLRNNR